MRVHNASSLTQLGQQMFLLANTHYMMARMCGANGMPWAFTSQHAALADQLFDAGNTITRLTMIDELLTLTAEAVRQRPQDFVLAAVHESLQTLCAALERTT